MKSSQVGGWTNPFEKYACQNGFIFPKFRSENENTWDTTTWKTGDSLYETSPNDALLIGRNPLKKHHTFASCTPIDSHESIFPTFFPNIFPPSNGNSKCASMLNYITPPYTTKIIFPTFFPKKLPINSKLNFNLLFHFGAHAFALGFTATFHFRQLGDGHLEGWRPVENTHHLIFLEWWNLRDFKKCRVFLLSDFFSTLQAKLDKLYGTRSTIKHTS